jgi:leader peptidase (prepilin peptidase) / N-methyltransferase
MWAPNADTGGSTMNFTPWWPGAVHVGMAGLDGYPQGGPGWGLCNFQELFGRSFTEMKSLTSLPVFISETDLAPLSTSQDCNGGRYQTITSFISDLFRNGGDGILQFQDGTTALTSAQWSELDAALARAPHPAPASSPARSPTPANTPATGKAPAPRTPQSSGRLMHSGMATHPAPARRPGRADSPRSAIRPGEGDPEEEGTVTLPWVIAGAVVGLLAGPPIRAVVFACSTNAGEPPRRECPGCSAPILPGRWRWWPVLPVTGRCPACHARIGPYPLAAELAAAIALALVAARALSGWELAALVWLALVAVPLALTDIAVHRLPDRLTAAAFAGTLALLTVAALTGHQPGRLARAVIGAAALACFYLALCLIRPGEMGLGDAKLAASIGLVLGWTSWQALLTGTFAGFALAAAYGGVRLATHQASRTSQLPLGPFILLGTIVALALLRL